MSTIHIEGIRTYLPDDRDEAQSAAVVHSIDAAAASTQATRLVFISANGEQIELSGVLFDALRKTAETLAQGVPIALVPLATMMTVDEAADFLDCAPVTVRELIEMGRISVESMRNPEAIALAELLDYLRREESERYIALGELTRQAEDFDLYSNIDSRYYQTR